MRFSIQTMRSLNLQGISISNVPYSEEMYKKEREAHYRNFLRSYYTDSHYDDEKKTFVIDKVKNQDEWDAKTKEYTEKWMESDPTKLHGRWYESTTLYIKKDDMLLRRTVGKSQVIDEDFVLKAIERDSKAYSGAYGQFAKDVNKMFIEKFGNTHGSIYPTTYGIGVWIFYNWKANDCIQKVTEVLNSMGVEYKNEFSDAKYVYRFVISKAEANRAKLC